MSAVTTVSPGRKRPAATGPTGVSTGQRNPIQGRATNVPVKEFVRLFLTEPVGSDSASPPHLTLYAEIVGSAQGNGGSASAGIFHDVVQLYR